ncbi:hypothetical protein GCM10020221_30280 [Streptomyces thioluteus]|uniref:N-acetyltransferase domain-containing protein n=1 Tax=Streptomyces thioluteus TaxID=66431 RepID=A0ABN3X0S5_STRTU
MGSRAAWSPSYRRGRRIHRDPAPACSSRCGWRPAARSRGAADLLVGAALSRADELGLTGLRLWVTEGNDPAERLYVRHGFTRTGAVQPVREGEDAREFEMARAATAAGDQRWRAGSARPGRG